MTKRKRTKGQTTLYKTPRTGMNAGAPEELTVPTNGARRVALVINYTVFFIDLYNS
jgi:hypothetical protein